MHVRSGIYSVVISDVIVEEILWMAQSLVLVESPPSVVKNHVVRDQMAPAAIRGHLYPIPITSGAMTAVEGYVIHDGCVEIAADPGSTLPCTGVYAIVRIVIYDIAGNCVVAGSCGYADSISILRVKNVIVDEIIGDCIE